MAVKKVTDGVYEVGVEHWDRRLFDELIPLPDGTSYNSYIIFGRDKTALIDTVDPEKTHILLRNLEKLQVNNIDYIVANHAEQDHSGSIPKILEIHPNAKIVTNAKAKGFLVDLLHIEEDRFIVIKEGDKLRLGGKTLTFYMTPWVHWPETMSTYLLEDGILFTCDFFGAHIASSNIFSDDSDIVYEAAKRYYAEIMMPFRVAIRKNIAKVKEINPKMIAPSHGLVYRNPEFIISAYEDWVSDNVRNVTVVAYVSMHGSTEAMVSHLYNYLVESGIEVKMFNLTEADIGEYAISLVDAASLVGASPMVLGGLHPAAAFTVTLTGALRPKVKLVGIMGSYGWGGMMVDQAKSLLKTVNADFLEPLLIKGLPKEEDLKKIEKFADAIVEKHRELGLL